MSNRVVVKGLIVGEGSIDHWAGEIPRICVEAEDGVRVWMTRPDVWDYDKVRDLMNRRIIVFLRVTMKDGKAKNPRVV